MATKPKKHDNPLHHPIRNTSKPGAHKAPGTPAAPATPTPAPAPPKPGAPVASPYGQTPFVNTSLPAAQQKAQQNPFTVIAPGAPGSATATAAGAFDVFTSTFGDLDTSQVYLGNSTQQHGMGQIRNDSDGPIRAQSTQTAVTQSVDEYARAFAQMSVTNPKAFAQQQLEMYQAGFYGTGPPRFGVFTTDDLGALKGAFSSYSAVVNPKSPTPLTFADYMDHAARQVMANGGPGGGGGGGGVSRAPLQLTDPTALNQTLQSAAQSALGRNLSDAELKTFVNHFHGLERNAYNTAGAGGTYTSPDVTGQAMTEVDKQHSAEEQQKLAAGYEDTIQQLLGVK